MKLLLAELETTRRESVIVLSYPAYASGPVSAWLSGLAFEGGDRATGGVAALARFRAAGAATLESCELPIQARFTSRPSAEVLAATHRPVQR